ncbi:hypothetical protein ACFW3A_12935 [Streptomyces pilosus]|uniref:hypothetical protein n=1 Tax=Streptomyces pilosus TaxID=28893 RepID=UPI003645EBAE
MGDTVRRPGSDEGWRVRGRQGKARGRADIRRGRRLAAGGAGLAAVLVLGGAVPGQDASALGTAGKTGPAAGVTAPVGAPRPGPPGKADPGTYAFAEDARRIDGAVSTTDAVELLPGLSYRSTLPPDGKVHYRLRLDGTTNLYASATAVPPAGRDAPVTDGVKVSLRNSDGRSCDVDTASFGAGGSPHPVTAWAMREISPRNSPCDDAGTYYLTVERADPDGRNSSPDAWETELTTVSEPAPGTTGATSAPEDWNSAPPTPATGEPERRAGGAGFAVATAVGEGAWRDDIRPGQTLFYKVPVDWGQQLHVTAELGGAGMNAGGYAAAALDLDLYNPARGRVDDLGLGYGGGRKSRSLGPLPPVAHANRYSSARQVTATRFAGSYYLAAHLTAEVADDFGDGPVPLTLRVGLDGTPQDGPGYAGQPVPADVFTVTGEDREAAAEGGSAGDDAPYRVLAVGGIGTGSALLVGLGVWTLAARRRALP